MHRAYDFAHKPQIFFHLRDADALKNEIRVFVNLDVLGFEIKIAELSRPVYKVPLASMIY